MFAGFGNGVTVPTLESVTFTGVIGSHNIDLLYENTAGNASDGARLERIGLQTFLEDFHWPTLGSGFLSLPKGDG